LSKRPPSLHVWYLPTKLDRGTAILSIGSSASMNCYLFVAKLLTRQGWSVVIYEYQGFGLSTGRPSLASLAPDLEAVLEWTRGRTQRPQVTLVGISLGAIPSVAIAARRPDAVNAVILDSPVALGEELLRFDPLLGGEAQAFVARLLPDLVSEERIRDVHQPLLVFLHELDFLTTPQQTQMLYDRAPGPKQLVRFANLDHAKGPYFSTDVYMFHADTFLSSVWTGE
jgi:pimeloyl-ACP methyl ester carboxylesterase